MSQKKRVVSSTHWSSCAAKQSFLGLWFFSINKMRADMRLSSEPSPDYRFLFPWWKQPPRKSRWRGEDARATRGGRINLHTNPNIPIRNLRAAEWTRTAHYTVGELTSAPHAHGTTHDSRAPALWFTFAKFIMRSVLSAKRREYVLLFGCLWWYSGNRPSGRARVRERERCRGVLWV